MDKIDTDVFVYHPVINMNLDLFIYTNPMHGDSGIENMDISYEDAEIKVCQIVENSPLSRHQADQGQAARHSRLRRPPEALRGNEEEPA